MYTNASRVTTCSYTLTALSTTLLSYSCLSCQHYFSSLSHPSPHPSHFMATKVLSTGHSNLLHTQCDKNRDRQNHGWYQPSLGFSLQAGQDWVSIEITSEVQGTPYHDLPATTHFCIPSNLFNRHSINCGFVYESVTIRKDVNLKLKPCYHSCQAVGWLLDFIVCLIPVGANV